MNIIDAINMANERLADFPELENWTITFSNAQGTFGVCYTKRKLISLSIPLVSVNNEEEVMATINHEIAHALTPEEKHSSTWKRKAFEIGGLKACQVYFDTEDRNVALPPKKVNYTIECSNCGAKEDRVRKPKYIVYTCRNCKRDYNLDSTMLVTRAVRMVENATNYTAAT